MANDPHSELEVVPQSDHIDQQKYAYYSPDPTYKQPYSDESDKIHYEQDHSRTICGLRKRRFWILVIVAIVIVAAVVGGAVGGAEASKSSSKKPSQPQTSGAHSASKIPTPISSQPTVSTSTIVGPTATIYRDCPSSNYTVYSTTFGDTVMQFRKSCSISFQNANSIDNAAAKPVPTLNDCINLCAEYNIANRTQIATGANRICNAVCWRNTFDKINDWPGGMCFGFTTQNITDSDGQTEFKYTLPAETRCDSAALINQNF